MSKIAIDISPIVYGTGVSVYTKELVKNLLKIDKKNKYILFAGSLRRKSEIINFYNDIRAKNTELKLFSIPPTLADIIWNKIHYLPIEWLIGKVDLVHTSDWTEPFTISAKKVTTVHDLTPIIHPENTHPRVKSTHQSKLKWVRKESDAIVVPSLSTKKDLQKLRFSKNKITVIPEAVSESIQKQTKKESQKILKKLKIKDKYILAVGTSYRKNLSNIINSFDEARKKSKVNKLVIVGEKPQDQNLPKVKGLIFTGRVDDKQLSALYTQAEVFVYASLYEGFGLPILEAFRCGCPVVASNVSSIPEIAKGAAYLVDPNDVSSITNGIIEVLQNKKVLIKKGKDREKRHKWSENAKTTLKIYNKLLK